MSLLIEEALPNIWMLVFPKGMAILETDPAYIVPSPGLFIDPFLEETPNIHTKNHYRALATLNQLQKPLPTSQLGVVAKEVRKKILRALCDCLTKQEEEACCSFLATVTIMDILEAGVAPAVFSKLLDKHFLLATVILQGQLGLPDDALFLNHLLCQSPVKTTRVMNSLRVVFEIARASPAFISGGFLSVFVSVVLVVCNKIPQYFEQLQIVRLTCIFLLEMWQRLLLSTNDDITVEIISFTVTWIQIKEAATLFRALKSLGG